MIKTDENGQISKEDADYKKSSSPAEHRCGTCTMVRKDHATGKHYCTLVRGDIDDMYGCKFYDRDLVKAANDPLTIATNPPEK